MRMIGGVVSMVKLKVAESVPRPELLTALTFQVWRPSERAELAVVEWVLLPVCKTS